MPAMPDATTRQLPAGARAFTVTDGHTAYLGELRRLVGAYIATWYPPGRPFSAADQQLLAALPSEHAPALGASLLAWHEQAPVGCLLLRAHPDEQGTAELRKMYVEPALRRSGAGRALLAAAVRRATGLGYRQLVLDVAADRTAAAALYHNVGFVERARPDTVPGFVAMTLDLRR